MCESANSNVFTLHSIAPMINETNTFNGVFSFLSFYFHSIFAAARLPLSISHAMIVSFLWTCTHVSYLWKTRIKQEILAVSFLSLHLHEHINSSRANPEFIAKSQHLEQLAIRSPVSQQADCKPQPLAERWLLCLLLLFCLWNLPWHNLMELMLM